MIENETLTRISDLKQHDRFKFRGGKKLYIFNSFTTVEDSLNRGQLIYFDNDKAMSRKKYPFTFVFKQITHNF